VPKAFTNNFSRIWFQPGGPGPSRGRNYHGNWIPGAIAWAQGDITILREPDPEAYGKFIKVGLVRGDVGNVTVPITARYSMQRSELLRAAVERCEHALQIHMGECQNPQDFARGWDKVLIVEGATITSYGTGALGTLDTRGIAEVNEDVPFSGSELVEVLKIGFAAQASGLTTAELTGIHVCDQQTCGSCGVVSDGCQVVLALMGAAALADPATVLYTRNGGNTWAAVQVNSAPDNTLADAITCVGSNAVVLSADDEAAHVASLSDILTGVATPWTRVATGFVAAHGPTAVSGDTATDVWIAGMGGYLYHSDDLASGVTVSNAGAATAQDLHDIHAFDNLNVVAVGASNAVVATNNGGISWSAITGPIPGTVLNAVWMHSPLEWLVGSAAGRLYYTIDGGVTWAEKNFPGNGAGQVRDIVFTSPSVGYMSHSTAAPAGRILRTIDGGYSWYVLPEGPGAIPTNQYVTQLAVCDDHNVVFGAGRGAATAGFLVKGA
jgi:photosystem II stability/assembly factor-like uncharacterized protein